MRTYVAAIALVVALGSQIADDARSEPVALPHVGIAQFERLSFDLRGHRLDERERAEVETQLAAGDAAVRRLYTDRVDAWLTKDALKSFVSAFLRFPPVAVVSPEAETYFKRLARTDGVYHLSPGRCSGAVVSVRAWWSKTPVRICETSYVPERIFDDVGYCSGEAESLMRQPPRPGCGCGPMLMGCLPPVGDEPKLDALVRTSVADEWFETAARIVADGHPLDELVTTTRTWQNGLAELLYARREVIADYRKLGWSKALEGRIDAKLGKIDLYAPGRWVERKGVYAGSGLWWTSLAIGALKIPVRPAAHHLLDRHLCMAFNSVNVDAHAVLEAVGNRQANLRTLSSLTAAPMRFEAGCKGCHAPMDGAAGFMGDIQGPLYGSYPTGVRSEGELFVSGGRDERGRGAGTAALAKLVVASPEFEPCSVRRAFEQVLQMPLRSGDADLFHRLVAEFHRNGHRWAPVLRALLLSSSYLDAAPPPPPLPAPVAIPASVTKLIDSTCTKCHDHTHELDLTHLPVSTDVATWSSILSRLADASMPPPKFDGRIDDRFPLDPSDRRAAVAAIAQMLGPKADTAVPPRRMSHQVWITVVRQLAEPVIGAARVQAVLEPIVRKDGFYGKLPPRGLPPPYLLAIETASEAICREVARADSADRYHIADPTAAARALLAAISGHPPGEPEVAEEAARLQRFQARTTDRAEAWIGLCSTELSGPRLLFADYLGGNAR